MDSIECPEGFSPDGLTEHLIDALLPLVWPQHPSHLPGARYDLVVGGSASAGRHTRPGGPNRQARAHQVGALPSPATATATEEIKMLQLHACVIVRCDQCGDSPGHQAHHPTEDLALDAAAAEGWQVGPGGRLWCSACATVLSCEADGHEFSAWRHPVTSDGQPAPSQYRHCRRCCLLDSRPARWLIGSTPGRGTSAGFSVLLSGAGAAVAEVA